MRSRKLVRRCNRFGQIVGAYIITKENMKFVMQEWKESNATYTFGVNVLTK